MKNFFDMGLEAQNTEIFLFSYVCIAITYLKNEYIVRKYMSGVGR